MPYLESNPELRAETPQAHDRPTSRPPPLYPKNHHQEVGTPRAGSTVWTLIVIQIHVGDVETRSSRQTPVNPDAQLNNKRGAEDEMAEGEALVLAEQLKVFAVSDEADVASAAELP
ncbi:hypothetical protein BDK51DRAFT_50768 [Blyttiomyces helicus]|uniref:Uncharacterized protein n=1 Tax=Blyttiomyces helicus TaxID=388810 RepID=A0A4P9WHG5_9FUNG|nr:hypothetical protein BDK51DRAFT_50768 [Blyttiomyces helicus]|eukprot:RKO91385.1 hypothetical protein BDK51DRAFT_50768 [Blyttiomyces helicus]